MICGVDTILVAGIKNPIWLEKKKSKNDLIPYILVKKVSFFLKYFSSLFSFKISKLAIKQKSKNIEKTVLLIKKPVEELL